MLCLIGGKRFSFDWYVMLHAPFTKPSEDVSVYHRWRDDYYSNQHETKTRQIYIVSWHGWHEDKTSKMTHQQLFINSFVDWWMFGSSCNVWILRFFCIAGEARPKTALVAKEKGTFESLGIWWKMSYEPKIYEWSMFKISILLHFYWSLTIHAIKVAATKTWIRNQSSLFGAELEIQHDGRTFWVDWRPKMQHKLESCHFFSNTFGSCNFPAYMSSFFLCLIWANSPPTIVPGRIQVLIKGGVFIWSILPIG